MRKLRLGNSVLLVIGPFKGQVSLKGKGFLVQGGYLVVNPGEMKSSLLAGDVDLDELFVCKRLGIAGKHVSELCRNLRRWHIEDRATPICGASVKKKGRGEKDGI